MNKALPRALPITAPRRAQLALYGPLMSSDAWRRLASVVLLAGAALASPLMQRSHAADAETTSTRTLTPQVISANAVTVTITPLDLPAGASTWEFKVVLNTHSQDLRDDLMKSAALVDEAGNQLRPIAWQGSPPGGHHREGLLRFNVPEPRPETIKLRLERPNEPEPRIFTWPAR